MADKKRLLYDQGAYNSQMQTYKREAVNQFWQDYVTYTGSAIAGGAFLALLLTPTSTLFSSPLRVLKSPLVPLYAGIAGGFALSQCADRFNKL